MSHLSLKHENEEADIYEKYHALKEKYGELYFATKRYFESKKELEDFLEDDTNEILYM